MDIHRQIENTPFHALIPLGQWLVFRPFGLKVCQDVQKWQAIR